MSRESSHASNNGGMPSLAGYGTDTSSGNTSRATSAGLATDMVTGSGLLTTSHHAHHQLTRVASATSGALPKERLPNLAKTCPLRIMLAEGTFGTTH